MKIRKAKEEDIKELCKIEMSSGYHKQKFNFETYLQELFTKKTEIFCSKEKNNYMWLLPSKVIDYILNVISFRIYLITFVYARKQCFRHARNRYFCAYKSANNCSNI